MPKQVKVYWDSCVFIDALQQASQWKPILEKIVAAAKSGDALIITSVVTLTEVLGDKRLGPGVIDPAQEPAVAKVFAQPYISVRVLDVQLATEARNIAQAHSIHPHDAIHVATALAAGASVMYTTDGTGKKKRGLVDLDRKLGNPRLRIEPPSWTVARETPLPFGPSEPGQSDKECAAAVKDSGDLTATGTDQPSESKPGEPDEPKTPDTAPVNDTGGVREGPPVSPEGGGGQEGGGV